MIFTITVTTSFPGPLLFTSQGAREERPFTCLPEKIRPREGSFTCYFLSRFIGDFKTRLTLCCAKLMRNSFNWLCFSVVFLLRVIVTLIGLKLNKVRCLEALYFGKSLCINDKINSGRTAPSPSIHGVVIVVHCSCTSRLC